MTDEEKIALKVACVQAAATMMAGKEKGVTADAKADAAECAKRARELFSEVVQTSWP
jgi:hypothetical protein